MPEFSFSISLDAFIIFLAALGSAVLSFFVYRVTIPALPARIRILLTALRFLGLFILFLIIAEPLVSIVRRTNEPPQTLLLVDNSRSMTITDKSGVRSEELRSVLSSEGIRQLSQIGDVRFALFDSRAHFLSSFSDDSLTLAGEATDLTTALQQVKAEARKSNIRSIVILSDGNSTSTSSPLFEAEDLQIPIFSLAIGDTTVQRDVLIRSVLTNTLTYAGSRVPVNVTLKSTGYDGQRVEVSLRDSARIVDRQFLTLQGGEQEYSVTLNVVPERPGLQKFAVAVSHLSDELTDRNNRAAFSVKVMESKMKVVILGGGPSADFAFVRRTLERDPNIDISVFIEERDGVLDPGMLTSQFLKGRDCLVLVGFPRTVSTPGSLGLVADAVKNGLPLLFLAGRQLDPSLLTQLESVLPVTVRRNLTDEIQCFLQVPPEQRRHVVLRRSTPEDEPWSLLPPLFQVQHEVRLKPEARVLAFSRVQNVTTNTPAIAIRNTAGEKSLAVMTYGLWRWKMMSDKPQREVLDDFLSNCIRWLTTRDDDKRIKVEPASEFFSSRDPVEFIGQVYDDALRPIDDARITVSIRAGDQQRELVLSSLGNGQYSGQWEYLPTGDYAFTAITERDGVVLNRETGSFSVGDIALEFLETRAHPLLLRQLASRTGGVFMEAGDVNRLPDAIRSTPGFRTREIVLSSEMELWNAQWCMILLLVLFASEWLIRKRFAMV